MNKLIKNKGFTLIEILVVIGIIAVLAAIVIVAINPSRQFAQARNTQRESNVNTILNAIGQNMVDNKGVALSATTCSGIDNEPDTTATNIGTGTGLVDLTCLVPTYISSAIPFDPDGGTAADTLYTIKEESTGRYTVCAPKHLEASISGSAEYCLTR
ncbi:MAG: type II secretion system protein [Candidatus Pacebacteria bacterium]|nr:type II secretion system protein [Candidatus Paceibacterota bacterium]